MSLSKSESQEGLRQELPVLSGSEEMEHDKASAFLWMKTSKEERLVNVTADTRSMEMPKGRCVPSSW